MNVVVFFLLLSFVLSPVVSAQVQLSAKIAKRIADATPKSLPQSPVAPKPRSDAEDGNLNGRVKTVVEEREYISGAGSGRNVQSITDFDEKGNRIKAVYFTDKGNPYEVRVFGYIDGARASLYKTIYEDTDIFTGTDPNEVSKQRPAPDPRYSYKYEYKYVGGRLAEMQMLLNNGEKGMRYVYNRTGNRMEELVYGYDGKLNQKYVTLLDAKGNEVEWHDIAVINLPRADRIFLIRTDAFDKKGNWTKRTFLRVSTENGNVLHEPARVEYRTMDYHG